jgi:serine/threonine protein kinase
MSPPDDGTVAFDGPMDPTDGPSATSPGTGAESDRESSSDFLPDRLIADLRLGPSERDGALGRLGHYDILSIVGAGAMGVVLKAFDDQLHRTVAIKVLSSHLMASEQARARFAREARAAAPLKHPNVVTIYAVEQHNGIPCLVMEFVDGITLQQRISRSAPMLTIDILRLSQQIAIGLSAAHRNGVIHRDIKPANIMLEDGVERVKITDFGLAKAAMGDVDLTSFGKMIGTPAYMSPEQVSGDSLDGRSDLYSLGCVMYSMVAGRPPFRGDNVLAIAHRIRTEAPPPLREMYPDLPRFLEAIILRLLEKAPEKRFHSADELAAVLTQRLAKANLAGSAYVEKADVDKDSATTRVLMVPETISPPRSQFQKAILLVALILVAALSALLIPRSPDPQPRPEREPDRPVVETAPPIGERPVIKVSRNPDEGDVTTIAQALSKVEKPWTRIVVLDDAIYRDPIIVDDEVRFAGLSLESPHRATVEVAPDGAQEIGILARTGALIDVYEVPDVTVRGFRLRPTAMQWGINVRGNCPGLEISEIDSEHPELSQRVFLYCHAGASGSKDKPIRLHHLTARCGSAGLFFTADTLAPIENIDVEDNVVFGVGAPCPLIGFTEDPGRTSYSHRNINVRRNVFMDGTCGVFLLPELKDAYQSVSLVHNTFSNVTCLVSAEKRVRGTGLSFDSNLVLDTKRVLVSPVPQIRTEAWFRNTHWEASPECDQPAIEAVAKLHSEIPMVSREFEAPGFLHPQGDALPDIEGPFPGAYDRSLPEFREKPAQDDSSD